LPLRFDQLLCFEIKRDQPTGGGAIATAIGQGSTAVATGGNGGSSSSGAGADGMSFLAAGGAFLALNRLRGDCDQ
jgi:hypothetical protein